MWNGISLHLSSDILFAMTYFHIPHMLIGQLRVSYFINYCLYFAHEKKQTVPILKLDRISKIVLLFFHGGSVGGKNKLQIPAVLVLI